MRTPAFCLMIALLLLLCSCAKSAPPSPAARTADMLNITNETADFAGCLSRFDAVCSAMEAKVNVLENASNKKIQANSGDQYFLNENYILTPFAPFSLKLRTQAAGFSADLTQEEAAELYHAAANGKSVDYKAEGSTITLRFVSEAQEEIYTAEYDKANDALRCTYVLDDGVTESMQEFLEFLPLGNGRYALQSQSARAVIAFDNSGAILSFACAQGSSAIYSEADSIYPSVKELPENWTPQKPQDGLLQLHTFANDILTHADCTGGEWKTVRINAATFASAFYV